MTEQLRIDLDDPKGQQNRAARRGLDRQAVLNVDIPEASVRSKTDRPSVSVCKTVLAILDDHVRSGEAWRIGQAKLAAECGLSRRSVLRALAHLTDLGLVSVERTGRANVYCINRDAISGLVDSQRRDRQFHVKSLAQQKCQADTTEVSGCHIRSDALTQQKCQPVTSDLITNSPQDVSANSLQESQENPPESPKGDLASGLDGDGSQADEELAIKLMHDWNVHAFEHECLPTIEELGNQRIRKLRRALRIDQSFESIWYRALAKIPIARDIDGWQPTFDWMLNPANCRKVAEGNFDRTGSAISSKAQTRQRIVEMIRGFGNDT